MKALRAYSVETSRGLYHFWNDNLELAYDHALTLSWEGDRDVYPHTVKHLGFMDDLPPDDNPDW